MSPKLAFLALMQSPYCLHVAHKLELLWGNAFCVAGEGGGVGKEGSYAVYTSNSKTKLCGSELKSQSHLKVLFSSKHCVMRLLLFACLAAIFFNSGRSNPVLFWQSSAIGYRFGSIINQSACLAFLWPRG